MLVVISSPSGGGKDSVIKALLQKMPNSTRFVTTTTRPPRPGDKEGVSYYFISKVEFEQGIKEERFLEYDFHFGNYYGTEKKRGEEYLKNYDLVFTQIEVNGKKNLDKMGFKHLSIYLLPESLEVLKQRIIKRGSLSDEQINDRLETAKKEIVEADKYDYQVVNYEGKLDETVEKVAKIIEKHLSLDKKPNI